jgi:hypothetical protein
MKSMVVALLLASASPALAQRVELTPLAAYSTSASIDKRAPGVDDLSLIGGFTWGGAGTWFLSDHVGVEALFAHKRTTLSMTAEGSSAGLFRVTSNEVGGNVVYQFGRAASWRPFVFGGGGVTTFDAPDVERDTEASWTIGGGLKWFVQRHVGVKGQVRYATTVLNSEDSPACGPFGFCQQALRHVEFAGGAVFRF